MDCIRLPGERPAFYCPETGRAISELFWGGWALYFCTTSHGSRIEGSHAGVALNYSHADAWLWGRDSETYFVPGTSIDHSQN